MNIGRYNKAIVAAITGVIVIWQAVAPDSAPDATEADVQQWVTMAAGVFGPILVYAVPNRA